MRCPHCNNRLLQKAGDRTKVRTKGPLLFDPEGACLAKCFWCGEAVEIPLELRTGVSVGGERFILKGKG